VTRMRGLRTKRPPVAALAAGILALAGTGAEAPAAARSTSFLFVTHVPVRGGLEPSGLWKVSPSGRVANVLGEDWRPAALSASGVVAAYRSTDPTHAVWLFQTNGKSGTGTQLTDSAGAACVALSPDGRRLSFVTGSPSSVGRSAGRADAVTGTLWSSAGSDGSWSSKSAVASGTFALDECPTWSPRGDRLAFLVRDAQSAQWLVGIHSATSDVRRGVEEPGSFASGVVHRRFEWSRSGRMLVAQDGFQLLKFVGDRVTGFSRTTLARIWKEHGAWSALRFSPNGKLLAARVGSATGIFTAGGSLKMVIPHTFSGWAGNGRILVLRVDKNAIITLTSIPVTRPGPAKRIERLFKLLVASDPNGGWFAVVRPAGLRTVVFRRPDGTVTRTVHLPFTARLVAAVGAGRVVLPETGY
jgi:dipeptidyl aminopeptidase/acylaminoacyl peptidase